MLGTKRKQKNKANTNHEHLLATHDKDVVGAAALAKRRHDREDAVVGARACDRQGQRQLMVGVPSHQ